MQNKYSTCQIVPKESKVDNTIVVVRSSFWWASFLRTLKTSPGFKRFCFGDLDAYVEHLRQEMVVREKGQFFYVVERGTMKLHAASGISLRGDVLYVHFFWADKYRYENRRFIVNTLDAVSKYYSTSALRYVMFSVPIELIGSWDGYTARVMDEYKRGIVWYKFPYEDFRTFAQFIATNNQSVQFVV